jgi:ribonuclease Z
MTLTLTVLGTSSMVPTKERNVQAFLLEYKGELILVDCGEGTQRQMNIAGFSRAKIRKVLITHWHGDHVGGLISLIQTIFNSEYQETLHIYGPKGSKERLAHLRKTVDFENEVNIEVHELEPGKDEVLTFFENSEYELQCAAMRHSTPTLGYAFATKAKLRVNMTAAEKYGLRQGPLVGHLQRGEKVTFKGQEISPDDVCYKTASKKLVFIPDTTLTTAVPILAEQADVMVCEATYANEHEEKAQEYKHLTASQAALYAQQAGVTKLVLTHFSQRYRSVERLLDEARVHHPDVEAAYDFMKLKI